MVGTFVQNLGGLNCICLMVRFILKFRNLEMCERSRFFDIETRIFLMGSVLSFLLILVGDL